MWLYDHDALVEAYVEKAYALYGEHAKEEKPLVAPEDELIGDNDDN